MLPLSSGITFGPVPSRRLGRSLGVNNIPYKHCSYSCIYCQIGRTLSFSAKRRFYYPIETVVNSVIESIEKVGTENIDYVTFVPDGEPTLDINLGKEISGVLENLDVKVAVITNGSLLFMDDVKEDLSNANLVSVKVDVASHEIFRKINRPHPSLEIGKILEGVKEFSHVYKGDLITETMLVKGVNDSFDEVERVADFIRELNVKKAYLAVPTRPPAEKWVKPADDEVVLGAFSIFQEKLGEGKVELLISYEGSNFMGSSSDPIQDMLSIISVHPMRIDYATDFLMKRGLDANEVIGQLVEEEKIVKVRYRDKEFIMRKMAKRQK